MFQIQEINEKMSPYISLQLLAEDAPYISSDYDNKSSNINRIAHHVDLLISRIVYMDSEFDKCLQLILGVEAEDIQHIPLSEIVKTKIDTLEAEIVVSHTHTNWKERVENLQDEIKHLRETMAFQQRILREERKLRDQLLDEDRGKGQKEQLLEQLENRLKISDAYTQTDAISTANKGVLFRHEALTRLNRGIQTLISISIPNHKPQPSSNSDDLSVLDPDRISTGRSIVSSRSIENQVSDFSGESNNNNSEEMPDTMSMHKFLELDMNSSLQTINNKIRGQNNSIQNLRSQVVDFAKSLEKAREEISHQQGTTNKKAGMLQGNNNNNKTSRLNNDNQTKNNSPEATQSRFNDSSSYLGGVSLSNNNRKQGLPMMPESRHSLTSTTVNGSVTKPETTPSQPTSKCLRCHKVYKIKDNHKLACRYHPKGRKKIEKYDANGKLSKVAFIWECCLHKSEALGCCNGEHM